MGTLITIPGQGTLSEWEVEITPIRAQGAGGQNVNKVSSAVHLRFDIWRSSLPRPCKERLLALNDQRISKDGVVVIKAQRFRSLEQNRADALQRLEALIRAAARTTPRRRPTRPTAGSRRRRLEEKVRHGRTKALRGPVKTDPTDG